MKRGIFLSIILGLCLITCIPQVMAQKQSRMEKLLRYLNDNDADKWQKNREKLDDETQTYYSEELALLDVLHQLWNEHSEQAVTNYFGCYGKAFQGNFSTICDEEKIQLSVHRKAVFFPRFVTKKKYSFPMYGTELNSRLSTSWKVRRTRFLSAGQ